MGEAKRRRKAAYYAAGHAPSKTANTTTDNPPLYTCLMQYRWPGEPDIHLVMLTPFARKRELTESDLQDIFSASRVVVRGILDDQDPQPGSRYLMHVHARTPTPEQRQPLPTFDEFNVLTHTSDRLVVGINITKDGPAVPAWEDVRLH
jgi:hypothetical protein